MNIKQISIFVENKSGRLAEITRILGDAGIDIRAISIADTSDFGILRLIVDRPDDAVSALKGAGMTATLTNVIAIGIEDKPGEFAGALGVLAKEGISIEYMYAFISRDMGRAYVILRVDDNERAASILTANGYTILTGREVHGM